MTDPIQFGANPSQSPSRNTVDNNEVRIEYGSRARYSYSEGAVVSLESVAAPRRIQETSEAQSLSPEQAASNILQFIAQRLASSKAGGATNADLEEAFSEAKRGFRQGLEQALSVLRGDGRLDETQATRLERLESRFQQGIESIAANLFERQDIEDEVEALTRQQVAVALGGARDNSVQDINPQDSSAAIAAPLPEAANADAPAALANEPVVAQFRAIESFSLKQKTSRLASNRESVNNETKSKDQFARSFIDSYQSTRASFKRKESVDLQLRTQDGDIVTLRFNAKQSGEFRSQTRFGAAQLGSETSVQLGSREFAKLFGKSELNIAVVGQLDDAEYAALQDIFDQLGDLFSAFFSGDNQGALEQAVSLNIDSSEIATLSLDLQLKQEQKLVQKYREIASIENGNAKNFNRGLTLADYLEQIREIAVAKTKIADKTLVEQLLSISFAGGDLLIEDQDDVAQLASSVLPAGDSNGLETDTSASPQALANQDLAELL
ncbi:MAG: DUF5610 domain-containing protein [Gammaproteobacteria bacterium]|nr:DUF5610 domain-containing protein [Gammaproteobacteria bacterium]